MEDFDNVTGFWIKGVPYLWVPGDSPYTSKRFYILHHNAAAVFDSQNHILDTTFIKGALYGSRLDPKETFSLFPIAHKNDCGIVRDHFLVWVFTDPLKGDKTIKLTRNSIKYPSGIKKIQLAERIVVEFPWTNNADIRVEGKSVDKISNLHLFEGGMVPIVNPGTAYIAQVAIYPWQFGNPHIYSHGGVSGEITFQSAKGKPRTFLNIIDAVKKIDIPMNQITNIHINALKSSYIFLTKENQDAIRRGWSISLTTTAVEELENELKRLNTSIPDIKWNPSQGWRYSARYPDVGINRILYEIAIGKRKEYTFRDPGNYGPENKPGEMSIYDPEPFDLPEFSDLSLSTEKSHLPKRSSKKIVDPLVNDKILILSTTDLKKRNIKILGTNDHVCFDDNPNKKHRKSMEDQAFQAQLGPDVWFYAVLDGHGGKNAAKYFMTKIPQTLLDELRSISSSTFTLENVTAAVKKTFLSIDHSWIKYVKTPGDHSGTTFTGAIVTPHNIFTINLGDSRTLILQGDNLYATKDHKPYDPIEKARIEAAGFSVVNDRVSGDLAVSRALGDSNFKFDKDGGKYIGEKSPVSPIPDVEIYNVKGGELILLACDGVFDVMTNEEAMRTFSKSLSCKDVVQKALNKSTTDNVTVMGIKIPKKV